MKRTDLQFKVRLPEALDELLSVAAKDNNRSKSAEMITRLEQSFRAHDVSKQAIESNGLEAATISAVQRLEAIFERAGVDIEGYLPKREKSRICSPGCLSGVQ